MENIVNLIKEYSIKLKETDDDVMKMVYLNTILRLCDGITQAPQVL